MNSWCCTGLCVAGTAHVQNGIPCQDFLFQDNASSGRRVVAIADGAGSARHSIVGANIASETIVKAMVSYEGQLKDIANEDALRFGRLVRHELTERSKFDGAVIGDYACTLLAAAFEGNSAYFWQVGDGAWIVESTQGIECATWPYKGEFNNETTFITSDDWESNWTPAYIDNIIGAMGFTDGLEMFCLDGALKKPHFPFVERIFSAIRGQPSEQDIYMRITQMLASQVITEREDDDMTLVLAWKNSPNVPG